MLQFMRLAALVIVVTILATAPAAADNTPAPPDWQDGRGASVYLGMRQPATSATPNAQDARYAPTQEPALFVAPVAAISVPAKVEPSIKQAALEAPIDANDPTSRRLAPPSIRDDRSAEPNGRSVSAAKRFADFGVPMQSAYTVITALAIVLGAFLLFAWAMRRAGKGGTSGRGTLPADVISVLGRVPLAARQFAELLRVGNKLVLVAQTPNGPTTLTEVNDPTEVDRLVGLCQQLDSKSTTKAFEQVFQQFSNEPASGFLGTDTLPTSLSPAALAYRSQRGAARV
jgi:flagellar biogenesis protein FliO